jgi:hypothetical protein
MKKILCILLRMILFILLVPGVLVTLPPKASKTIVLLTHALLFGIIDLLLHKFLFQHKKHIHEGGPQIMTPEQIAAMNKKLAAVAKAPAKPTTQPAALPQCKRKPADLQAAKLVCNPKCTQNQQQGLLCV